ncbi:MAG: 30S ribosomal protein S12 methylthiotransferase RimO [Lachnospiraceae bacterium]|jgi:ribosomal protein S12 methylthiotransferase|nr:30S ribosomal protein S12 methylthiotransferase RimO [Lachnospiraceae bacterium]MCI9390626.1 30S ribosomal protein S12 methylthiotransferase RimO [Lachnospiraceae bacterium]MCI9470071.1 30S ribosomal protein S12 methylthiotransferase RimO [Lachnospiraceae bacterium]
MEKILFISLGCDKNLADSEEMLGLLASHGYQITDDEACADAIVINTCCFIGDAKEESIQTILEMAEYRKSGPCRALVVAGCLAQRYQDEIAAEIPEVDVVLGTTAMEDLLAGLEAALDGRHYEKYRALEHLPQIQAQRVLTTGGHYAYLKIAEGCDKHCTYCIIPKLRGRYRSIPMERLAEQAESLAAQGVRELILVAQETTIYGQDIYGERSLHRLLERLCQISGLVWIRVLYCYPEELYPKLIDVMAREPKICHYLDIPIQHASDPVLKRMGRRTSRAELEQMIQMLRREIPDIVLRTTLITGFPGETQEDHETLMDFVRDMRFDRLGVFTYSAEEDTPAAVMEGQIPEEVKEARRAQLMELQQEISMEKGQRRIGQKMLCMIEGAIPQEGAYVARTYADAPDVDGYLFIKTGEMLMSGNFVQAVVTGAMEYDLIGELENEYAE